MTVDEYDFVIVGGGTSGLVVAARLSEDPNVQVLVVEAGANRIEDPRVKIPALYQALKDTEADWSFSTVAQVIRLAPKFVFGQTHWLCLGHTQRTGHQSFSRSSTRRLKRY